MKILLAACLAVTAASSALAQDYPNRPIRMIVPFGPGGVTDITARTVAPLIAEALNGTIIVENRAGGSTIIGTDAVAKAKPDGYTLLLASSGALTANPVLHKLPFDTARDLAGVSMVSTLPYVLAVHPTSPFNSAADLIAAAKAKPKTLSFASAGVGTGNHLTAELFSNATGIDVIHVPYKSGGEMITAVMAGTVVYSFSGLPAAIAHIRSGKAKALGVTSEKRYDALPDTPTINNTGVPGFVSIEWTGILVPAGTPAPIVTRLNAAIVKVLASADAMAKLKALGSEAESTTPARLDTVLREDMARWAKLAQTVKFTEQ
jgi:tripartite-type tricarboxylate transporter receptor subunit TctC